MSATPIPRTLALLAYGDLNVSVLDELPPGRSPVETFLVGESMRQRIHAFTRKQCERAIRFISYAPPSRRPTTTA